jgi:hypothetical protein
MNRYSLALLVILLLATPARADYRSLYTDQDLAEATRLYGDNVKSMFYGDLIAGLPPELRAKVRRASIDLSDPDPAGFPFMAVSYLQTGIVQLPVRTVKFLDDLGTVMAWLQRNGCDPDWLFRYLAMLIVKPPPATGYPDPWEAFDLPADPWADKFVYTVSMNMLKSGMFFILAHEVGHLYHQHLSYEDITREQALEQEIEADRFALETMRNIGVPPLGAVIYFTVHSLLEGKTPYTHPLSGSRITAIAEALEADPVSFVSAERDPAMKVPVVLDLAHQMRTRAAVIDDEQMQSFLLSRTVATKWSDLRTACR